MMVAGGTLLADVEPAVPVPGVVDAVGDVLAVAVVDDVGLVVGVLVVPLVGEVESVGDDVVVGPVVVDEVVVDGEVVVVVVGDVDVMVTAVGSVFLSWPVGVVEVPDETRIASWWIV